MARIASKPKKEVSMEEALWKSADKLIFGHLKVFVHFYLIHASSFAAFVGLDIVDGGYNGHFICHRFHQTGERYSLTGLLIEKVLNLFKFRFR